jgi:hypothetical protein
LIQRCLLVEEYDFFGALHSKGRIAGDLLSHVNGFGVQDSLIRIDLIDQIDGLSPCRVELMSAKGHLASVARSHNSGEALQASHISNKAQLGLRKGKYGLLGAEPNIAA